MQTGGHVTSCRFIQKPGSTDTGSLLHQGTALSLPWRHRWVSDRRRPVLSAIQTAGRISTAISRWIGRSPHDRRPRGADRRDRFAQTPRLQRRRRVRPHRPGGVHVALGSSRKAFDDLLKRYASEWRAWCDGLLDLRREARDAGRTFCTSALVLRIQGLKTTFASRILFEPGVQEVDSRMRGTLLRSSEQRLVRFLQSGDCLLLRHGWGNQLRTRRPTVPVRSTRAASVPAHACRRTLVFRSGYLDRPA